MVCFFWRGGLVLLADVGIGHACRVAQQKKKTQVHRVSWFHFLQKGTSDRVSYFLKIQYRDTFVDVVDDQEKM